jgi:hypothetical protein
LILGADVRDSGIVDDVCMAQVKVVIGREKLGNVFFFSADNDRHPHRLYQLKTEN